MKKTLDAHVQLALVLILGCFGLALRLAACRWAVDEKGLLITGHAAVILVWVVTALAAAVVLLPGKARHSGASFAWVGGVLGAVGLILSLPGFWGTSGLALVRSVGAVAAGYALLWEAVCRRKGTRPTVVVHGVLCLFLVLHLLTNYRIWSRHSQMLDFAFPLFASLCLLITAYWSASRDLGKDKSRLGRWAALAAVYCCLVSLGSVWDSVLHLGLGLWAASTLEDTL